MCPFPCIYSTVCVCVCVCVCVYKDNIYLCVLLKKVILYIPTTFSQGFEYLKYAEHDVKHHRTLTEPLNKMATLKILVV